MYMLKYCYYKNNISTHVLTISHEIAKNECFIEINKTDVEKCVFGGI